MNAIKYLLIVYAINLTFFAHAQGEDLIIIETIDGETYEDVRILEKGVRDLFIIYNNGVANIPITQLSIEDIQRFGFDLEKAKEDRRDREEHLKRLEELREKEEEEREAAERRRQGSILANRHAIHNARITVLQIVDGGVRGRITLRIPYQVTRTIPTSTMPGGTIGDREVIETRHNTQEFEDNAFIRTATTNLDPYDEFEATIWLIGIRRSTTLYGQRPNIARQYTTSMNEFLHYRGSLE